MSYTYLQEQGAESSAESFLDIPAYVLSRLNLTAEKCCSSGNATECCQSSRSGTMCEPLTENRGAEKSMSCVEGSRARTLVAREKEAGSKELAVDYGKRCGASLARYDQNTRSLRTHQCSLLAEGYELLQTLPEWGCLLCGELLEVTPPAGALMESASGLSLMRPIASDGLRHVFSVNQLIRKNHQDGNLSEQVARVIHKKITPECCEILMNWPEGWTDLNPLEMVKILSWLNSHGKHLEPFNKGVK